MRRFLFILFVSAVVFFINTSAMAAKQKLVALVLGNGEYIHASELPNPPNDARAFAEKLESLGFDVQLELNLTRMGTEEALQRFIQRIEHAKAALFFYAGHGLQVNGINYIVPVDAELAKESDLLFQVIQVQTVLNIMEAEDRVNLVFLDACRDNPLARSLSRSMGKSRSTSVQQGLAPIDAAVGTLISYATKENNVASDGEGEHSPYTQALLRHIGDPVDVGLMLRRVREEVIHATNSQQVPWEYGSLIGEFYFLGPTEITVVQPAVNGTTTASQSDKEALFWESIKDSDDPAMYEAYLKQYPDGTFADLARMKTQFKADSQQRDATPKHEKVAMGRLTVKASPADAQVRILNIKPVYHDDMELETGKYLIEVSKQGYEKHSEWIDLAAVDFVYSVLLQKEKPSAVAPMHLPAIPMPSLPPASVQDHGRYTLSRHADNQDTVTDKETGLMWMQRDDARERKWAEALNYCNELSWGGYSDWRAPDMDELKGLKDRKHRYPDIDPVFECESLWYWSRTSGSDNPEFAWVLNFNGGLPYYHSKIQEYYVRCVREDK